MAETAPGRIDVDHVRMVRPRLRGVSHQWAFVVSVVLGVALVLSAPPGRATTAAIVFATSVTVLFGVSAVYHRVTWRSVNARRWMRRVDHAAIFVLIAGTFTPFALLTLDGTLGDVVSAVVWAGAGAGILINLLWIDAPKWLVALVGISIGWVAVAMTPDLVSELGIAPSAMVAAGGVLYTAGAIIYARRRPDPAPTVFGYHEIFHALVVAAAALQYAVIAFWVLPNG